VALGLVPACPLEDRPATPPLLVRAASQGRVSVTLGFDGEPTALTCLAARLEEVVRWPFGDLVELERDRPASSPGWLSSCGRPSAPTTGGCCAPRTASRRVGAACPHHGGPCTWRRSSAGHQAPVPAQPNAPDCACVTLQGCEPLHV